MSYTNYMSVGYIKDDSTLQSPWLWLDAASPVSTAVIGHNHMVPTAWYQSYYPWPAFIV